MAAKATTTTLRNGVKIPVFGLGTWQSEKGQAEVAVNAALNSGYRLVDTAAVYGNEKELGSALSKYFSSGKLKREDVFITTKLWCSHNRTEDVEPTLKESLEKLQLKYVDLYLIHQPACFDHEMQNQDHTVRVEDTWRGMEQVYDKGLTRAIGVSNFNEEQISRILMTGRVPVHCSQVELHLYFQQQKHVEFCLNNQIAVTAYAPIGSPGRSAFSLGGGHKLAYNKVDPPLQNADVVKLAQKYNKTPAQVLLRHLIQKGIIVIPKSSNPERIKQNIDVFDFELSSEEMEILNAQPQGKRLFTQDYMIGHPEDPWKNERVIKDS